MKIALAQISPALGAFDENLARHLDLSLEALARGADLIVFPELSLTGYDVREQAAELALEVSSPFLRPLLEASQALDIVFGMVELGEDFRVFNSAICLAGGEIRHRHRKVYLPTYGRFDEGRYFAAGDAIRAFDLWADGSRAAKASGRGRLRAGLLVCEDVWHPSVAWLLAQDGAHLLVAQAAASDAPAVDPGQGEPGEPAGVPAWERLATAAAIGGRLYFALANRAGRERDHRFFGRSFIVDPRGEVIARAPAYEEELMICEIDFDLVKRARFEMPLLRDERLDLTARELRRIRHERFRS